MVWNGHIDVASPNQGPVLSRAMLESMRQPARTNLSEGLSKLRERTLTSNGRVDTLRALKVLQSIRQHRFADLHFGSGDAKDEVRLGDFFLRVPAYERVKRGQAFFVLGRKGTGKTAICQMLHAEAQNHAQSFSVLLSFKNQPSLELANTKDGQYRPPNEFISTWRFLIALESAKLLLGDESIDWEARRDLESFLKLNFGNTEVSALDALQTLRAREWTVGFKLPFKLPGAEWATKKVDADVARLHYGRAATALLDRIGNIRTDSVFYLLFDELDEEYRLDSNYFDMITSLLKATYQIRLELRDKIAIWPIVVLRDDIFSHLDDHDLSKFDEYLICLRWGADAPEEKHLSLRELVELRIRASVDADLQAPWDAFVNEASWGGPGASAWSYLQARGMDRPRDCLKSLSTCQLFESNEQLHPEAIAASCEPYSAWFFREIGSEIFRQLPDYRNLLSLFRNLDRPFDAKGWKAASKTLGIKGHDAIVTLERLYRFGVVGSVEDADEFLFSYRAPQIPFPSTGRFTTHPGLSAYLRLREVSPFRR